jgi:hypothetical protein
MKVAEVTPPRPGQVLVDVEAAGINYLDVTTSLAVPSEMTSPVTSLFIRFRDNTGLSAARLPSPLLTRSGRSHSLMSDAFCSCNALFQADHNRRHRFV